MLMNPGIRRPNGSQLWVWRERIYIPCPLSVKNEFTRIARENRMSQAELGTAIVDSVLESDLLLRVCLLHYRKESKRD